MLFAKLNSRENFRIYSTLLFGTFENAIFPGIMVLQIVGINIGLVAFKNVLWKKTCFPGISFPSVLLS